jgi:hypothetical protein
MEISEHLKELMKKKMYETGFKEGSNWFKNGNCPLKYVPLHLWKGELNEEFRRGFIDGYGAEDQNERLGQYRK